MDNEKNETKRVGYVFRADTVEMLRQLGEVKEPVMFEGRTATWLVEFAIHEFYHKVISNKEPACAP